MSDGTQTAEAGNNALVAIRYVNPIYAVVRMNSINRSALLLRDEPIEIRYENCTGMFPSKIYFDLAIHNSIVIEAQVSLDTICGEPSPDEPFFITFCDSAGSTECYVISSTFRIGGDRPGNFFRLMPRYSNIIVGLGAPLVRIEAGVLNFAFYFPTGKPESQSSELRHDDWVFSFIPVDERIYLYPLQIQTDEYAFTHHVSIRKVDGDAFSPQQAQLELDLLADFLTFCRGFWVSTALTVGIAADGSVAMEEFGTRKVSPKKVSSNWLDFHHGNSMSELFPKFVARMTDLA